MHAEDYDVGRWPTGEPPFLRKRRTAFLQQVTRKHTCDACHSSLPGVAFNKKLLENAAGLKRKAVCQACQNSGYSPKDCTTYPCSIHRFAGHIHFSADDLNNWKRGRSAVLTCRICDPKEKQKEEKKEQAAKLRKCEACQVCLPEDAFNKHVLFNARPVSTTASSYAARARSKGTVPRIARSTGACMATSAVI